MPEKRIESQFDESLTSEKAVLWQKLENDLDFPSEVSLLGEPYIPNPRSEDELGRYRPFTARKAVTADMGAINEWMKKEKPIPSFLEAGPRALLFHSPQRVRAAIVTTGGLAPGLNCVVHSIVNRHCNTYHINENTGGGVFGVYESFMGLCNLEHYMKPLSPSDTEEWLHKGGSILGIRRYHERSREELADAIAVQLSLKRINILYVIGGDGSLSVAHEIATRAKNVSVVGIPKTMDNDVMWVWQSFGFRTAVEKATEVINTLNFEAEATRRVCIIELFGAESGFVAANASLASGRVDLVLIPEEFQSLNAQSCELVLEEYINFLKDRVLSPRSKHKPHAVVVLAEGVAKILKAKQARLCGKAINKDSFAEQLRSYLEGKIVDGTGRPVDIFLNQPRHHIRAIPANSQDQIYCERLGALAVDSALAGFTDFVISQWVTEYVLVPLELVKGQHKRIPIGGIFWKQVVNSTGQPYISKENMPDEVPVSDSFEENTFIK
jgi:6-phosphofructokinase 1